jgi:Na+/proline symporter
MPGMSEHRRNPVSIVRRIAGVVLLMLALVALIPTLSVVRHPQSSNPNAPLIWFIGFGMIGFGVVLILGLNTRRGP